ncbi:MAG TPA: NYN domain-containing protein [Caldisericia bacterium]|jgi:uncharacterized LabA/DUF88 family protein|nr:MAG: 6-hydroxy-3-succinoylpyridine 3-monooxygenase HspA [bacterium ADurb.Bin132]HNW31302.1 NYN domain-containing protein [Caldisericia bacterium]HNY61084.1 NYN domain-containing protein [Caldisericia bacterium]HOC79598.1 NYN domain-containing protein [Caldisericia bacterium]HOG70094.1 NYN domain-containing protein [Caldisericia bacterium]
MGDAERVAAYIDGFNLYFGMKNKGWRRYYWLNVHLLAKNLLKANQTLILTKYFTSRITTSDSNKFRRQNDYIEALSNIKDLEIYYGKYKIIETICPKCGSKLKTPKEKMTDVNIATHLMKDAYQDIFDAALLITGDSDLVEPVKIISELFPKKRVIVAFPPGRVAIDLKNAVHSSFVVGRKNISISQLDEHVTKEDGCILTRPNEWK